MQDPSQPKSERTARLGRGQIAALVALVAILVLTVIWAAAAWTQSGDVAMDWHGWIALGLGTFFSIVIGCGLMALMFFSSRSGHDEAAASRWLRDGASRDRINQDVADLGRTPRQATGEITGDGEPVEEGKRRQQDRRAREERNAKGPFETLNHLT